MLPNLAQLCTKVGSGDVINLIAEKVAEHNFVLKCKVTVQDRDRYHNWTRNGSVMRVRQALLSISWGQEDTTGMSELVDRALELLIKCYNNYPNRIMVPDSTNIKDIAQYGLDIPSRKNSMTQGKTLNSPYAYRLYSRNDETNHSIEVFMEIGTGRDDDGPKKSWFEHLRWTCDTVWRQLLWLLANPQGPQMLQQKKFYSPGDDLSKSARVFVVDEATSFSDDFWNQNGNTLMEHPFEAENELTLEWSASHSHTLGQEHKDLMHDAFDNAVRELERSREGVAGLNGTASTPEAGE